MVKDHPAIRDSGRSGHAGGRRRAAWTAIFAIVLQILIPALHHPAGMAQAGSLGFGAQHNICFSPGANTPTAPDKSPHHQAPTCALCQAVNAIGGLAQPSAPVVITATSEPAAFIAFPTTFAPARPPHFHQQPRAPPALA
jgi:hypothetical protein